MNGNLPGALLLLAALGIGTTALAQPPSGAVLEVTIADLDDDHFDFLVGWDSRFDGLFPTSLGVTRYRFVPLVPGLSATSGGGWLLAPRNREATSPSPRQAVPRGGKERVAAGSRRIPRGAVGRPEARPAGKASPASRTPTIPRRRARPSRRPTDSVVAGSGRPKAGRARRPVPRSSRPGLRAPTSGSRPSSRPATGRARPSARPASGRVRSGGSRARPSSGQGARPSRGRAARRR